MAEPSGSAILFMSKRIKPESEENLGFKLLEFRLQTNPK